LNVDCGLTSATTLWAWRMSVDVLASGAVCLGSNVVCDGFVAEYAVRVQTHLHDDHMAHFERSKGIQDLFMSPESLALLVAERNSDMDVRSNFHSVPRGTTRALSDGSRLTLLPSGHMLGSCQVGLELPNGLRVGYSGDFGWPLDEVIEVEELVVDSTYGSPETIRRYSQAEAEQCLIGLVCARLRHGSVHVKAYRGTIERVLHLLGGNVSAPIIATRQLIREAAVYRDHGFAVEGLVPLDSPDGRAAVKDRGYVRLYSKGDGFEAERIEGTTVTISAYMADLSHPLTTYSDRAYKVALSNHADFEGTLAYVEATKAHRVVTDNTRNHGCQLALAITERLGVEAEPSSNQGGPRWR
jgi:putative mRNA 3-end processing factor